MCRRKPLNIVSLVASLFTQKQFFSGTNMFISRQTEQQTHFGCAWHGVESLLKLEFTWSLHLFGLLHFVLWYELWAISAGSLCLVYALNLVKPVNFSNLTTFSLVLWKRRVTVSPYLFKMPREVFTHPHFLNKFLICIYILVFFFFLTFLLYSVLSFNYCWYPGWVWRTGQACGDSKRREQFAQRWVGTYAWGMREACSRKCLSYCKLCNVSLTVLSIVALIYLSFLMLYISIFQGSIKMLYNGSFFLAFKKWLAI